jgi:hypothetical protein
MKFKAIYSSMALLFGAALFLNNSSGPIGAGTGDRSGALGATCNQCHGSNSTGANIQVAVLDTLGAVQTSYNPGQRYRVIISSNMPVPAPSISGYGFNLRARADGNTIEAGGFQLNAGQTGVRIANGITVEHTQIGTANGIEVRWTAPAAGTDTVTFYGAGVVADRDGSVQGDIVPVAVQFKFPEAVASNVREAVELSQFVVFPTQAESQINLRFVAAEAGQYTAEVVNISGQVLSTQVFAASQGEQTQSVEVNNLATGTYFVRLRNNQNTIGTKAFVKF